MRPTRLLPLAFCFAAATVHAEPTLRLSWESCDNLVTDRSWAGPGSYAMVLSGTGFTVPLGNYIGGLAFSPWFVAPAWDFATSSYFGEGVCQDPAGLSATTTGGGCPSMPGTSLLVQMSKGSLTKPGGSTVGVQLRFDPAFVPDPAQRYTLARIVFDHAHSVVGPGTPGSCGGAEQPTCVNLSSFALTGAANQWLFHTIERGYVTWQDPTNGIGCPGATPAAAKTWGAVRAQYR